MAGRTIDDASEWYTRQWDIQRQEFGEHLREIRVKRGLTTQRIAGKIGVHRTQVERWERGETVPQDYGTVVAAAEAYRLNEEERKKWFEIAFGLMDLDFIVNLFPKDLTRTKIHKNSEKDRVPEVKMDPEFDEFEKLFASLPEFKKESLDEQEKRIAVHTIELYAAITKLAQEKIVYIYNVAIEDALFDQTRMQELSSYFESKNKELIMIVGILFDSIHWLTRLK
jgi:transcriptional regulator with XRE-family HTH domain